MIRGPGYDPLKRGLDVLAAGVGLVVLAPVIAGVAIVVAVRLGTPVLFRQARPGRAGAMFTLVKFRSMRRPDPAAASSDDADRLTPFGRALRATSLDELPTLVNVLRGEMSIVGPRPLLPEYLPLYDPVQRRRHEVRPGVTGLAQARGRNAISWEAKFDLDVEYVDRRSLALDARILVETVATVLRRSGIAAEGHATVERFRGSAERGTA